MPILDAATKADIVKNYLDSEPTSENSIEIAERLAEDYEMSINSIRMLLNNEKVWVKKEAAANTTAAAKEGATGTKRVSKESAIKDLRTAIEAKGKEVDDSILEKLTGKAAVYLLSVIKD